MPGYPLFGVLTVAGLTLAAAVPLLKLKHSEDFVNSTFKYIGSFVLNVLKVI